MSEKKPPAKMPERDNYIKMPPTRRTQYIFRDDKRYRISFRVFFTLALIFLGGLSAAVSYAYINDVRRRTAQTRAAYQAQREANATLRAEITQQYTLDEVERIATERLGMNKPDVSQIVNINVRSENYVVLNDDFEELQPESLWQTVINDIKALFQKK